MQSHEIGIIGGKLCRFYQVQTLEEAQKIGLPNGVYSYWEFEDGERVISPHEITMRVQDDVFKGNFDARKLTRPKDVENYYQALVHAQRQSVIDQLVVLKEETAKEGVDKSYTDQIEQTIAMFKRSPFPDSDGSIKYSHAQATESVGGKENLDRFYNGKEQRENFPGGE